MVIIQGIIRTFQNNNINYLVKLIDSRKWHSRLRAAKALGILNNRDAVLPLISNLNSEDNDLVRYQVIETLGILGDTRAAKPLTNRLLYYFPNYSDLDTKTINANSSINKDINNSEVLYLIYSLGKIKDTASINILLNIIENKNLDSKIRSVTLSSIGHIGDTKGTIETINKWKQNVNK